MILDYLNYWAVAMLMMIGLYITITQGNLVKKLIGLNLFQTSVFIFYISVAKVSGGTAPIVTENSDLYSNPLPHVLILTAIVVGISTLALALSLVARIKATYDSIEEDEIRQQDSE
ncbi:MAG: cation:proton antiporter subunit C [Pseudohongiellaceae bacterium]